MKRTPMLICVLTSMSLGLTTPALADDTCELAAPMAQKAAKLFATNQAEGLKLFIKAREFCPDNAVYAYNLGAAYYRYGRLDDARPLLESAATSRNPQPLWLNNLASLLLDQGKDAALAVKYAELAVKAGKEPEYQDTLARSRFAAGKTVEALQGLAAARQTKESPLLKETASELLDQALATQLQAIKDGRTEAGLAGLAALDFEPKAQQTRVAVLARLGRGEEALTAVKVALVKNPGDRELKKVRDEAANQVAAGLYRDFQAGQGSKAAIRAKKLSEQYPDLAVLRETYDKLFEALTADAGSIAVPEAVARATTPVAGAGSADLLLAGIGGGSNTPSEVNLSVDVDQNIPRGQLAGRDDVAVVIGNGKYGVAGTPHVDYALRDAAIMREYLIKTLGYDAKNILHVENATYAGFAQLFGKEGDHRGKLNNFVQPGKSRVFVYYVGHGAPDPESGDAYFVPVDADPQFLKSSGYRLQTFYDNLSKIPALSTTVVLDSCFSGNSAGGMLFKGVSSISLKAKAVAAPQQVTVFASSRDDQMSNWYDEKRHSLFTYYFLKGLGGEADADKNRSITVAEMETYLNDNVPRMARRLKGAAQAPQTSGDRGQVLAVLK